MNRPAPTLRLYLTALPGDLDGERAVLEGWVLPELRARAARVGVELAFVEPGRDWDLGRRFQAIEECQAFVALLGERYGEAPGAVPLALVAAQPWIAEDPGRSVLELEVLYAAMRSPMRECFFYLRDPRFPSLISEERRSAFLPESKEAGRRMGALKERIRALGRPGFDGYPAGWSEGLGRASRLDPLAERMVEDLWQAIQKLEAAKTPRTRHHQPIETGSIPRVPDQKALGSPRPPLLERSAPLPPPLPKPPAIPALPPEKPLVVHENVQFTVYRPRTVEPAKWYPLLAFAHLEELPADAPADEPDPIEEVKRQARQVLGEQATDFSDVKQDSRHAVPHEAEITFVPELPGFEVNPPRRTFLWLESVHREEFRVRAGARLDGTAVRGRMSVFWGSILLAEIGLAIRVDSRVAAAGPQPTAERSGSQPFRRIFPSYSHRDAGIVEEFERYARTLGDRYMRDVHELRAGEVWNDRLRELIGQADVFQLFWSWNALRSRYVEEEWRYALSLGRSNFVRPTYWETPLPEEPGRSLPPEDLRRLHFQLLPGGKEAPPVDLNATVLALPGMPSPPALPPSPPPVPSAPRPDLDETDATAVAAPPPRPAVPPLPPPVAAALPPSGPQRSRRRSWVGPLAMIALAVVGLSLYLQLQRSKPEPTTEGPRSQAIQVPGGPISAPVPGPIPKEAPGSRTTEPSAQPIPEEPAVPTGPRPSPVPSARPPEPDNPPPDFPTIDLADVDRLAQTCRLDATDTAALSTRADAGAPMVQVFSSGDWLEAGQALGRYKQRGAFVLPWEEDGRTVCRVLLGPYDSRDDAETAAAGLRGSDGVEARVVPYPGFLR